MAKNSTFQEQLNALEERLEARARRLAEAANRRQEALFSLHHALRIDIPLPPFAGYAMAPEVCVALATEILVAKPGVVFELGSGVSTVIAAYAVQRAGQGHIYAVEHEPNYLAITQQQLADRGLAGNVTLMHCPLRTVELQEGPWQWYDLSGAQIPDSIDLMVVDGPPAIIQPLSRYPALPLLRSRLTPGACIILDDAARDDELEVARRWMDQFTDLTYEPVPAENGALLFRLMSEG